MVFDDSVRYSGGVAILKTPGSMTMNSGCEIRAAAVTICEAGNHWILLDCSGTARVDSFGLGEMVAAYSAVARRWGGAEAVERRRPFGETLENCRPRSSFGSPLRRANRDRELPKRSQRQSTSRPGPVPRHLTQTAFPVTMPALRVRTSAIGSMRRNSH